MVVVDKKLVFIHDCFNIIAVSIIVSLDIAYLVFSTEWEKIGTSQLGSGHESFFNFFYNTFALYLILDTIWIISVPSCVLSNHKAIVVHHLATGLYMVIPYFDKQFSWHMGMCLLVEMNTLFLTLRRNLQKGSLSLKLCEYAFYLTWTLFRIVLYPIMLVFVTKEYSRYTIELNTWWNMMLMAPIFQGILTVLGFKWSIEILKKLYSKKDDK